MKQAHILAAVWFCLCGSVLAVGYSGGAGTAASPYQIANPADWQELMETPTDWGRHFLLTAHLDLADITLTPVGNTTTKFTGVIDGAGYTISNAVIDQPDVSYVALFGYTWPSAIIRNIRLENAQMTGKFWVGGLVGSVDGTTIENVAFNGAVTGVAHVGGIAGLVSGMTGSVSRCYSTGTVTASRYAGGLIGYIWGATLENCYTQASIVGVEDALGGDLRDLGGLIGRTYETTGYVNTVTACYAAGPMTVVAGTPDVGGLVGHYEGGTFTNCFWDTQLSGQAAGPVGIGKTTAQMKRRDTFAAAGWDFIDVWADGQNQAYPFLRLRPSADIDGDGLVTLEDVAILAAQWLSGSPAIADYDGIEWVTIDDPGFHGQMSKYETTNAQFAYYLNAALASGHVRVEGSVVKGSSGIYSGQNYYRLDGSGYTYNGAVNGGKARIGWTGRSFTVEAEFENHPVTHVSWYGATAFASYYGWRLPTEWEWQAAADFDGTFTYGCGTTINNTKANYAGSAHPFGTTPVGHFGAFGYGLADMSGNCFEWTSSVGTLGSGYYTVRGGSWQYNVSNCAVTYRYNYAQNYTNYHVGFRVCR